MIHPDIRNEVLALINTPYVFPQDILDELRKDEETWNNFLKFSEPYKRIRVAHIDAARKRPEEFQKRLEIFISKTKKDKMIVGYGGIDKYYGKSNGKCE